MVGSLHLAPRTVRMLVLQLQLEDPSLKLEHCVSLDVIFERGLGWLGGVALGRRHGRLHDANLLAA